MNAAGMNEPLAVREAPASYVLDAQPVGRASARHVGLKPDLHGIPQGYKQTEVGVIPEDWDAGNLGEYVEKVGSGVTPTGGERVYKKEGRPFLRSQNVGWGNLLLEDVAFIDNVIHETFQSTEIVVDDVFLNITGASIGRSAVADERVAGGNVNQHVCIIRTNKEQLHPCFLNYFLLSKSGQRQIDSFQAGGNRQGLNFGQIRSFQIFVPPLLEQRAIAAALSDVDALLAKLDQLIAKKRDLKQAAMQQLLTGSTRLPGFGGEWESLPLPEVCWFQEGPGVRAHQFKTSGVKLLNGTNISNGKVVLETTTRYISNEEANGAYKHFLVDEGDILIATSGITIDKLHEKVAITKNEMLPLCMNTSTVRFKIDSGRLANSFLYFFLQSDLFKKQIGQQATGSAQINFGPSHLGKIEILIPPSLPEQTAIATILSDIDAEIAALEARRDKTRDLKQSMMQELLTGRIRLV